MLQVDITDFKVMDDRVRALADEDALTGLPNRHAALALIDEHLARIRADGGRLSVLFFDSAGSEPSTTRTNTTPATSCLSKLPPAVGTSNTQTISCVDD